MKEMYQRWKREMKKERVLGVWWHTSDTIHGFKTKEVSSCSHHSVGLRPTRQVRLCRIQPFARYRSQWLQGGTVSLGAAIARFARHDFLMTLSLTCREPLNCLSDRWGLNGGYPHPAYRVASGKPHSNMGVAPASLLVSGPPRELLRNDRMCAQHNRVGYIQ